MNESKCEWCNVKSRNQNDLDKHLAGEKHQSKAYTKKKNLPVQNGPQDGAAANAAASSSRKKHKGKANRKMPQKCALCNKMISREESLKSHVEKVHGSKKPGNAIDKWVKSHVEKVHKNKKPDHATTVENFGSQDGASTSAASYDSHLNGKRNKKGVVFNPNNHNKNQIERKRSLRSHTETVHERKKTDCEVMNATPVENWKLFLLGNANDPNDSMLEPLIAQIRDLFPELGEGFLAQCLDYFDSNTERVINALLEDNLPPHLANLDRALAKPPQPPANVDQDQGNLLRGIDN